MKAILLSGGMDSTSVAYWKKPELAITINYGQKPAAAEIRSSRAISNELGIKHEVIEVDVSSLGSGDMGLAPALSIAPATEWWPFRNQLLITLAAMKCASMGVNELMLGTLAGDSFHCDGSIAFYTAIDHLCKIQEGNLRITTPAILMSAVELVRISGVPIEILAWAHSCHVSNEACGVCRGCQKHYETMEGLGVDPY